MVSVDDEALMTCRRCEKRTLHETNWDGEDPDALRTKCKECGLIRIRR